MIAGPHLDRLWKAWFPMLGRRFHGILSKCCRSSKDDRRASSRSSLESLVSNAWPPIHFYQGRDWGKNKGQSELKSKGIRVKLELFWSAELARGPLGAPAASAAEIGLLESLARSQTSESAPLTPASPLPLSKIRTESECSLVGEWVPLPPGCASSPQRVPWEGQPKGVLWACWVRGGSKRDWGTSTSPACTSVGLVVGEGSQSMEIKTESEWLNEYIS